MALTFVKYCPLCKQENLSIASFCDNCDADLMNTSVELRREEDATSGSEITPVESAPNAAAANPIENSTPGTTNATTGPAPGGEASGGETGTAPPHADENEVATRRAGQIPGGTLELQLVANPAVRFVVRPDQSVGRSGRADVVLNGVPDLEYISRTHARFLQRRTQWYVQYIAEGNSITVDGVVSQDNAEMAIYDESIVVLSFTAFRVKVR